MSCVAEVNPTIQNTASVSWKNISVGIVKAIPANDAANAHCIISVHLRFVDIMSINGLHTGFMTHGRYSHPVYNAMSVLDIPKRLYIITESVITAT